VGEPRSALPAVVVILEKLFLIQNVTVTEYRHRDISGDMIKPRSVEPEVDEG